MSRTETRGNWSSDIQKGSPNILISIGKVLEKGKSVILAFCENLLDLTSDQCHILWYWSPKAQSITSLLSSSLQTRLGGGLCQDPNHMQKQSHNLHI
jgi:hypothetical protein